MMHCTITRGPAILPQLRLLSVALLALALAACAANTDRQAPATGAPQSIGESASGALIAYLARVKSTRPGAFAVSADGADSFYAWCDDIACVTQNYSMPALNGCRSISGKECFVLYVRNQPRFAFSRRVDGPTGRHGSQEQPSIEFD
jgi:hypothetical protein